MTNDMYEKAYELLRCIQNKELAYVGRSGGVAEFVFGDAKDASESSENVLGNAYLLSVLCPFRIIKSGRIIIGGMDMCCPLPGSNTSVDLEQEMCSVFDEKCALLGKEIASECVKDVLLDSMGDIHIELTSIKIDVIITTSTQTESWSFYSLNSGTEHLVFCNGNLEFCQGD